MKTFIGFLELTKNERRRINGLCSINADNIKPNGDFYAKEQVKINKWGACGGYDNPYTFRVIFENRNRVYYDVRSIDYCYYIACTLSDKNGNHLYDYDNFYDVNALPNTRNIFDRFDYENKSGKVEKYIIKRRFIKE